MIFVEVTYSLFVCGVGKLEREVTIIASQGLNCQLYRLHQYYMKMRLQLHTSSGLFNYIEM